MTGTTALLSAADRKEGLSLVYVKALAARAGFSTAVSQHDRDGVDLRIMAGGPFRPALDLQLKATSGLDAPQAGFRRFRLSAKNYRDLRVPTQTPRLLVVLELPSEEPRWMTVTEKKLVLRRRAYWMSLQQGHDEAVAGQQTITVRIPKDNLFNIEALEDLMEQSRLGSI